MPGGRPRKTLEDMKFPENWKDIVFEMSSKGCSDVEIRAAIIKSCGLKSKNITGMWYALQKRDEEFYETIKIAKELCQAWWEQQGREALEKKIFQTGCWYANMKNRFAWKDQHESNINFDNAEEHFKIIADAIGKSDTNSS